MRKLLAMGALATFSVTVANTEVSAQQYDMDCKVILCLAGGFPAGCGDARSYMYKRLKKGKPPFGICTTSGGEDYDQVTADYQFLYNSRNPEDYRCPAGYSLDGTSICYKSKTRRYDYQERGYVTRYEDPVTPQSAWLKASVIVGAGTPEQYKSPEFKHWQGAHIPLTDEDIYGRNDKDYTPKR